MATEQDVGAITDEDREAVSGGQLCRDLGITDDEIVWRKSFTGFEEDDAERLAEMEDTFDEIADDLVEEFYAHLQTYDEALDVLDRSSKSVEMLKRSQAEYLRDLGRGSYGAEYFERRARIGKIHDMLDMGPRFYLGAYTVYYEGILDAIVEDAKSSLADGDRDPAEALDRVRDRTMSVLKLLSLDQQVAMDTYIHSYSMDLETELDRQQAVADEVETAVDECKRSAGDVTERAERLVDTATQQEETMGEIATEVSNLSATIEEVASTADEVDATSSDAEQLATEGRESADRAIEVMEEVDDVTDSVVDDVAALEDGVGEIDEIVDLIDDIAEQTNILALNASIEAARAGEAGEGFAVVADEVKQLAEESQSHAVDIDRRITTIQTETEETIESLDEMTARIEEGIDAVEGAMEKLHDIVDAVAAASEGIQEVADATDDQAASTEEVASMVDEAADQATEIREAMDTVADANRKQAEQVQHIADTVQELTESQDSH